MAIELAAAQVAHFSPRQIVERLGDRLAQFTAGRGRPARHRSLHGALDWSLALLDDEERALFRRLAVFPGSFSPEAALAMCEDPTALEPLQQLLRKSLIVGDDDGAEIRYRMLETVRAYAMERLLEAGEESIARDRHRDFFLAWAESIPPELTYLDPRGDIRREQHNLRAALRWSERRDGGTWSAGWPAR